MTDAELIIAQGKELVDKNAEVARLQGKLEKIRMKLINTGAPLNDNFLKYSDQQLITFFKIQDILND